MNIQQRIERISQICVDCLTISQKLSGINEAYVAGQEPDHAEVKRLLERLETREVALLRHTTILHHEASQTDIAPQVGGGDKDEEYP